MGDAEASCSAGTTSHQLLYPERKPRILLVATGCLAAQQFVNLCLNFYFWADIKCVGTKTSLKFINRASLPKDVTLYIDENEWSYNKDTKGGMLHIKLCKSADVMVIAPLSANSLAKIGGGISDNLVTKIVRAWDYNKPLLVAPSMTKLMWTNPLTQQYLKVLRNMRVWIIDPTIVEDQEEAVMSPIDDISNYVKISLQLDSFFCPTDARFS